VAPPAALTQPLYFGSENPNDSAIPGLIDEVRFYSGVMPTSAIAAVHEAESEEFLGTSTYEEWAAGHGIDPDGPAGAPGDDFDSDGTSNETERALGLLPNNSNSSFTIGTSGIPEVGMVFTWPSQPGLVFTVKSSADLSDWSFTEATVPAAQAPATTTSWTVPPTTGETKKFFRVELNP
jgi:hypothetical protein